MIQKWDNTPKKFCTFASRKNIKHNIMKKTFLFLLSVVAAVTATAQDLRLWYSRPAEAWTDALPVGNSRMGAMVFGGIEQEELQLNEETFWSGGPHNNLSTKGHEALGEIRQMVFEGKFGEAQKRFLHRPAWHAIPSSWLAEGEVRLLLTGEGSDNIGDETPYIHTFVKSRHCHRRREL